MKSSAPSQTLTIGELAQQAGVATHVLRHWEDVGLLRPARHPNGRRCYEPADLRRVALVLLGKRAGLSLDSIARALLAARDRSARRAIYREQRDELVERISSAQASLAVLEHALECDAEDLTTCPALAAKLESMLPAGDARGPGS